ncbi:uncharacterized protein TM35_000011630 [Trypanosoma theileri]|uniref:Uncharacterized protein n=1 Tax=Trypanosoma theileri TaxID=67003 RepID=A0A1X0P8M0_9TRYP|nr:uncharacterized protein TM35_000011630 [Trypanosoma theileri]ORC93286.1 hypothetical protein TM35_000011630 [Trypanosoma theileri]
MDYSTAQRLARLHAIDTATETMEQEIDKLTAVVGRRSDGWREADAELKTLWRQMLTQCPAEVRELTVYGFSEKAQKDQQRTLRICSNVGVGVKKKKGEEGHDSRIESGNIGENDTNATKVDGSFSASNSSNCCFDENKGRGKPNQLEHKSVPESYSRKINVKNIKKRESTIRHITPIH